VELELEVSNTLGAGVDTQVDGLREVNRPGMVGRGTVSFDVTATWAGGTRSPRHFLPG